MMKYDIICLNEKFVYIFSLSFIIMIILMIDMKYDDKYNTKSYDKLYNKLHDLSDDISKNISKNKQPKDTSIKDIMLKNKQKTKIIKPDKILDRDDKVLNDILYPPLDRVERPISDNIYKHTISTRYNKDTYRLMGYLTLDDT